MCIGSTAAAAVDHHHDVLLLQIQAVLSVTAPAMLKQSVSMIATAFSIPICITTTMYGCKGSSGLKPCCVCTNVYDGKTKRRIVENDRTGHSVYHHCTDRTKFNRITPTMMAAIVRRLASASPAELAGLETNLGWKLQRHGIMFQPSARRRMCPSSKLCVCRCTSDSGSTVSNCTCYA